MRWLVLVGLLGVAGCGVPNAKPAKVNNARCPNCRHEFYLDAAYQDDQAMWFKKTMCPKCDSRDVYGTFFTIFKQEHNKD